MNANVIVFARWKLETGDWQYGPSYIIPFDSANDDKNVLSYWIDKATSNARSRLKQDGPCFEVVVRVLAEVVVRSENQRTFSDFLVCEGSNRLSEVTTL